MFYPSIPSGDTTLESQGIALSPMENIYGSVHEAEMESSGHGVDAAAVPQKKYIHTAHHLFDNVLLSFLCIFSFQFPFDTSLS